MRANGRLGKVYLEMFFGWCVTCVVFWLNSAGMYTALMQRLSNLGGNRHEVMVARSHDMHGGNNLTLGQLPYVQFMKREHAVDL